jgi:hypothetical protein
MPREIIGKGLRFSLRHAPCAHICRYCLISESRKRSALPFARFEHLVQRFIVLVVLVLAAATHVKYPVFQRLIAAQNKPPLRQGFVSHSWETLMAGAASET